jgi:hypothetical protein
MKTPMVKLPAGEIPSALNLKTAGDYTLEGTNIIKNITVNASVTG